METYPGIEEHDLRLSDYPSVSECRGLRLKFKSDGFWPNVWVVSDHGNPTLLAVGYNGYKVVGEWV